MASIVGKGLFMSTFVGLATEAVAVGAAEAVGAGVRGDAEAVRARVALGLCVAGAAGSSSVAHWPPGPAWEGGGRVVPPGVGVVARPLPPFLGFDFSVLERIAWHILPHVLSCVIGAFVQHFH
jgi:hypothetical protein